MRVLQLLVAACLALSAAVPQSAQAGKPAGGSGCALVPQLRDVTINQGVGSYARLVRGKEALVRFYLSLPSCASTSTSIAITGGSLTVSAGGSTTTHGPFPTPASPYPVIAPHASAPALDAPGDPRFVVPGSVLAPAGTTASFTATFSVTLSYLLKTSKTDPGTAGTVTFNKLPGTSTDIARTVDRLTKALRVLVVPMGDASKDYASQFSSSAQSALESGMLTLSRIFPVPDGTDDLAAAAAATGGVRYTILPTLLDIGGLLGSDGKFCGGGSNFDAIKGELGQFLLSWNAANPSATADRVVGVIDEAISNGSSLGCADGWSAIGTQGSWVRAITSASPGTTGALLAMEIGHSMGLVPTDRDHTFDPYHSPSQEADGGTNRSYDIRSHTFIPDDRTTLRGTGTWNNATTLLEPVDYAFLLCMLGGSITTDCSAPNSVGTATGVGAGPRFVISGTTGGTAATTVVTESYFAGNVALTEPPAASDYSLVQLRDGVTRAAYPIAVETVESLHDDTGTTADDATGLRLFAAVVPFDELANRIELRHGTEVLYARDRGERPVISSTQVVAAGDENYTDSLGVDDTWPMVSPDGQWVAWTASGDGTSIVVAPIGDAGASVPLTSGGGTDSQPAWNPDSDELAFIRSGDLVTVALSFTGGAPVFGAETVVYDAEVEGPPAANHPSWSLDGTQIAFDANGAIFVVDALEGSPAPEQLTFTGDASHPSWSWAPDDNRIAYQRNVASGPVLLSGDTITLASYVEPSGDGPIAPASHAGTEFVVNSADDAPSDGVCDVTHCNLREAITAANALAGKDSIHFAIGSELVTIQPTSALPIISDPVIIDGFSQPAVVVVTETPLVELDGSLAGATTDGLVISAADSVVQGLIVNRFGGVGISLTSLAGGSVIRGNYIGTSANGTADAGNGGTGIEIFDSPNNTIGGTGTVPGTLNAWEGNLISGNTGPGIYIGLGPEASGNDVLGNFIGTDSAGTAAIPNGGGVAISAPSNIIGGTTTGARNVISGNAGYGIDIGVNSGSSANQNIIQGNYIGTNVIGTAAVPNTGTGVFIGGLFSDNVVGGTAAGAGNLISGNTQAGIRLEYVTGTVIQGNLVGTDAAGTADLGNGNMGIFTFDVSNTLIGGTSAGSRNVIAGNTSHGVRTSASSTTSSTGNVISGNYVGVDISGNTALPNGWGVGLTSSGVTLGGSAAGAGNVISGNTNQGVSVGGATTTNSLVQGNLIGLGADGTTAVGNGANGIHVVNASGNTIGGTAAGEGNRIAHNGENGIEVWRQDGLVDLTLENAILGNSIHSNGGLGIDLCCGGPSVTENDAGDVDDGANRHQNFPVLTSTEVVAGDLVVGGTLNSAASMTYRVEYFSNAGCDASGNGEGRTFVGFEDVTTDASGNATLASTHPDAGVSPGAVITATATDPDGNTSEFSDCATAADGGTGTLVVNTTSDSGTGGCTVSECTLREAIIAANATAFDDTITFDIPGSGPHVIQPGSQLPAITDSVTIDAATQPGYAGSPLIELDGSLLDPFGYGLVVGTGVTTVRGFAIHGFPDAGIRIDTDGAAGGNLIADNWIGLDAAGAAGTGQPIGILVFESPDNTIQDNVISANDGAGFYGIGLFGGVPGPSVVTGNVVQGNLIGVAPDGSTAMGNAGHGVVANGVSGSRIGGVGSGQGNVIANNGGAGVLVADTAASGNAVLGNAIHDNGSLGIDLGGGGFVAANDNLDADTGPNELQNYPSVTVTDDGTTISGTLLSAQASDYRIELFRSSACDTSGNGEGQTYLGFVDVTTNADGYATFTFDASGDPVLLTDVVTVTATDADGNTSEFSACAAPTPTGPQVWTVDPAAPSTTQEALVADAAQPAFGSDGRVAFVRDDAIYSIGADGTGVAQLTSPGAGMYDSMPSPGGVPAFARFFDDFDGGGQWDVFLLRGQVQVVTTVTDDGNPADLRLDIYYQCLGSPAYDVAVALTPDAVETGSATWSTNYDPSLACPDGTLTAIASDGFLRSDSAEAGEVDSQPQAPVPTIYAPFAGQEFLQYQGISLHGGAKDAEDGEVANTGLAWYLDGALVGTGGSLNLSPPGAGWISGAHTVTLRATDSDGTFVETSVEIIVLADADNDWLPANVEADTTCFGADADTDPTNSFGDADGDGYSNIDDMLTVEGPCDPADAYTVFATFGPDVLYIPSSGDSVTITVTSPKRDLKQVAGSTVRISDLSGAVVSIPATNWTVDKKGVGVARFSREAVSEQLTTLGLVGQTVTVTITGTSITHSWTFTGTDTFEAKAAN